QISACTYTLSNNQINIVNDTAGVAGNSYTLTGSMTGLSISGPHLTGGRDAASSTPAILDATIALGANPVVSALAGGLLDGLMAHAVVESRGVSLVDDENWRTTISSRRIIPLSGGVKIFN